MITLTRVISVQLGQYHGCWCPGSLRRQDISSHNIDYVEYVSPGLTWERILSTCVISMWSNDIKCKYMFYVPSENLAHKGLSLTQRQIAVSPGWGNVINSCRVTTGSFSWMKMHTHIFNILWKNSAHLEPKKKYNQQLKPYQTKSCGHKTTRLDISNIYTSLNNTVWHISEQNTVYRI